MSFLFRKRPVDANVVVVWFLRASNEQREALLVVLNEIQRNPEYEQSLRHLL